MSTISGNRPLQSNPLQRTTTAPAETQAPTAAPREPATPQAPAQAERQRDSFSLGSVMRPTGRAQVTTQGDNFVMEAQAGVGNRGSTRLGAANIGGSFSLSGSLRVEVPRQGVTDAMRNGELPNPAAPETWPVGTRARAEVQGGAGVNGSLPAGPGKLGQMLGIGGSYEHTQTQRYEVQRVSPDTVRASVTSTARQQDSANIRGLEGRQDQTLQHTRSADFNITTPEGRAAYQQFMSTGQVPTQNAPGVTNVRSTDSLDGNRRMGLLGQEVGDTARQTNVSSGDEGHTVRQTDRNAAGGTQSIEMRLMPDGSARSETRINDSVRATTTNTPGQPARMNYELSFNDPNAARMARGAFSANDADAENGAPFSVNLNEQQARALVERTLGPGQATGQRSLDAAFRALSERGQQAFAQSLFQTTLDTQNPSAARRPLESTQRP